MMTGTVVQIAGAAFATELMWQPLAGSNPGERQAEIKVLSKELGLAIAVEHSNGQCVGFAGAGIKPATPSLAVAVATALEEKTGQRDFIYVAEIGDGEWYYLAQKDGVILADGDTVFSNEDHAKAKYFEDGSIGEWKEVILPVHWGISGAKESTSVKDVLPLTSKGKPILNKNWRVKAVNVSASQLLKQNLKAIILLIVLLSSSAGGFWFYQKWKFQKMQEEAARIQRENAAASPNAVQKPKPWAQMAGANAFLTSCMQAIGGVNLFPGNWEITAINCTGGMLTVSWKPKDKGWIDHLRAVEPTVVIALDGSMASRTTPVPMAMPDTAEDLVAENDRVMAMHAAAQRYGVKFVSTPAPSAAPVALPGQDGAPTLPDPWTELRWRAEGVTLPESVTAALDGQGFRLTGMLGNWNNGQITWTMEGSQYVLK